MNDDLRSLPYDPADYLKTPEQISAYLEAVLEEGDERVLMIAIQAAVRAASRIMPVHGSGSSESGADLRVNDLLSLMHQLGFELSLRPKRAA